MKHDLSRLLPNARRSDCALFRTVKRSAPIAFAEALEETLAIPEPGDRVRAVAARTARDLGLDLRVAYEARSVAAMKSLVQRGAASSILPYFSVIEELRADTVDARPIVMPALRRTLFLASSKQRGPFKLEAGLTGAVRSPLRGLIAELGPLAHPPASPAGRILLPLLLIGTLLACAGPASAYPDRPIRLTVPFIAGSPVDALARIVAERVSRRTGQPLVIENQSGAGGTLGTRAAAHAAPDGHTVLFALNSHAYGLHADPG